MMMKHHNQQQQQQQPMNGGSGMHGGGSPTETKWWYKGPDGETYGPYKAREMHTWGNTGYFNESLPVKTENDDCFHPIGDWMGLMGGANPFAAPSVPAFNVLMHGAHAQQFLLYPPGLPTPAPFAAAGGPPPQQQQQQSNGGGQQQQRGAYGGPAYMPTNGGGVPPPAAAATAAAMANLHLGGGAHMGMHPMHHGGPLSQPPSEGPGDGANSSNSHTPDSAEPDFRTLHQMGGMPMQQQQHAGRMQFGYGMPPMQQQHPHQQQQLQHPMGGGGGAGGAMHAANGQLQYTRVTSTHDAPWNSRREVSIDASQRPVQGKTISTQTLPVIIGSKDASRILSDLTGCAIVIT